MSAVESGELRFLETCSFACEIDFTQLIGRGRIEVVQSEGTLRLRISGRGEQSLGMEITEKTGEPNTKVHRYMFK